MNKGGSAPPLFANFHAVLKNKTVCPKTPGQLGLISVCWTN